MSLTIGKILAPAPAVLPLGTDEGLQPTQLSVDNKGERIVYASGKSIYIRSIDDPSVCKQYNGHKNATTTVARFSPSGFYIASGDKAGNVRIWDAVEVVNTKGEYPIISGPIKDIAWDGDSQRIIAVGKGSERFGHCITADSGNSVGEISGHSKSINAVALRQQRPLRAATVSDDCTMCFFHGAPFKFNSKVANIHSNFIYGTAFSPDGAHLVTVGADRRIQLYNGKTGEPTVKISDGEHKGSILGVSWAKDSQRFVTASTDGTVKLWGLEPGPAKHTWNLGGQQFGVVWVHGRSDGLVISINRDGDLLYLHEGSDKATKVVQGHNKSVTALGASSDGTGQTLWTGSFDGRVCKWDVSNGISTAVEGHGHTNQVAQFAGADGQTVSVGWDDKLRTINESTGSYVGEAVSLSSQPQGVAVGSGLTFVATIDGVDVYRAGKLVAENRPGYTPAAIAAHGSIVATGSGQSVKIYTVDANGTLSETKSLDRSTHPISCLSFSKDGKYLAAGNSNGSIDPYDTNSWEIAGKCADRWAAHNRNKITCISWNDAGTHVASGSRGADVVIYSLANPGRKVKAENAHIEGVTGVAWVAGGKVASVGWDAAVKIWATPALP
ncbi:WD repeat-containing protein [Sodiomyces alkalinus F11]|uniref:WD repeat-containing protein n=1 Tax=Sodiomyces alkalinus (strain CBS 110278 / VKM F-3762 / F11) TaxID=1314773 RepID=A0A3N2PMJ1_SODAK|nr:WD repeat-containing protein [Sodiomyces alkalinus F11]ROT35640.1 WD repeat-containing protein [Sodiomyces alkalinus F11]